MRVPRLIASSLVALSAAGLVHAGGARAAATAPVAAATGATASPRPTGTELHVTLTLRPRDPVALAAAVRAVSTPGSRAYGHYLTPRRFAARFGARPAQLTRLRATLAAHGLHPGAPAVDRLSIPLVADRAALARAGPRLADALGPDQRSAVLAVVGQSAGLAARPLAVRPPRLTGAAARDAAARRGSGARRRAVSAGPAPCAAATAAAAHDGAFTDDQLAAAYGLTPLYAQGRIGARTTVAVYELEPNDPHDIAAFQACYGTHATVRYLRIDGGAGSGAGSDEAAFDIENVIGFAPGAHVLVYQGPNSTSGLPGSGPYDVFEAIVDQDRAQVITNSWGQCEAQLGRRAAQAEHVLFQQAALQGQTFVSAAGDDGAQDCDSGGANSSLAPAVDDPAAQPDVLGVGGTTLDALGPPPVQTVWNSGGAHPLGAVIGAGGGGISSFWAMAPAQFDTPARLHVHQAAARGHACGHAHGDCREVPDVAADADPTTGYEIYWNGADSVPEPSGWQALGGTSGAAPFWAALLAIADSDPACRGVSLGDVDPALYRAASEHYAADFDDVVSGNNDFTGTNGGRWAAGPGYDLATGLGTPDAAHLVADLCADSVSLTAPGAQSSAVGAAVRVALAGHDVRGARLRYAAHGLPPGVRVRSAGGRLIGRPTRPGRYAVRVIVTDGRGSTASRRFTWGIGGAPRLTAATLSAGRLTVRLTIGRHVPRMSRVRLHLPAGLRVRGAVGLDGARVRVRRGVVSIIFASPTGSRTLSLPVAGVPAPGATVTAGVRAGSTGTSVLRRVVGR